MNTPIEPSADDPKLPEAKTATPGDSKPENSAGDSSPAETLSDSQKSGSVYTKGLLVCGNCGTELLGDTCYRCGQPTKGLVRQFSSILGDFLDTVLNIDTRVFRTIGPLIYRPGFLTQEYFSGRRIRYVSPVRLFFFLAVLTFLLAQFSLPENIGSNKNGDIVTVNNEGGDKIDKAKTVAEVESARTHAIKQLNDAKAETKGIPMVAMALEKTKTEINGKADKRIAELTKGSAAAKPTTPVAPITVTKNRPLPDGTQIDIDNDPDFVWDVETNPIKVDWLPDSINKWFNSLALRAKNNNKRVNKDPKVIIDAVLSSLPMTLFIMLPVFALLLKVMFIFKRRLYMEHLIVALHSHAFLMLAIMLLILFNDASAWLAGYSVATSLFSILTTLLWIWMPIYLFLMQKRVYQQGWILTFIKYAIIGNLHMILLSIAIGFTLIIKMIWL